MVVIIRYAQGLKLDKSRGVCVSHALSLILPNPFCPLTAKTALSPVPMTTPALSLTLPNPNGTERPAFHVLTQQALPLLYGPPSPVPASHALLLILSNPNGTDRPAFHALLIMPLLYGPPSPVPASHALPFLTPLPNGPPCPVPASPV